MPISHRSFECKPPPRSRARKAIADLRVRRAAAVALSDELQAKLDAFPTQALRVRLHAVSARIDDIDARLSRLGAST
jgi:hypothetical protein